MEPDWIDELVERWPGAVAGPGLDAYRITGRISRIAAHLTRGQEAVFARYGLGRADVGVLSSLRAAGDDGALSPTRLFKDLMLSSAGMTSVLDRLESRGLLARRPDPADRRALRIRLTDRGRKLADQAVAANAEREQKLLAALSARETAALASLLKKVLARLETTIPPAEG